MPTSCRSSLSTFARVLFAVGPLLLVPFSAARAEAGVVDSLAVWRGAFDVVESNWSTELGGELRFASVATGDEPISWTLRPAVGVMRTSEDGLFGHVGLRLDLPLGDWFIVTPQLGAGYYDRGDDKNLGGHFQFRSGIEATLRVTERHSLGVLLYHLSNAGINEVNPGEETLAAVWSVSF